MADPLRAPLGADALSTLLLAPAGPLDRLEVVASTGSTNDDLVAALRTDPRAWAGTGLLVADHQLAGHGRAGRGWETPAGTSLTCSFVTWPEVDVDALGWLPLLAGLGVVTAVRATAGVRAELKWPNDVLVPGDEPLEGWGSARKVSGILTQAVPTPIGLAVVVGIGVNVAQRSDELAVPSATSLALAGARDLDRETMLVALVESLAQVTARWRAADGDVVGSGLAADVAAVCRTLGTRVRVELPGDELLEGTATALDDDAALLVVADDGTTHRVLAGDVRHVRDA
ncbi:biotin--[acetyl-CoA-carboxylase] ligase [Cellulomonas sp. HZM]|uniref:biotin--[acetyl-CoA-carboxylase] ligase n=1 Tax=Cellulomonas sp. HZM TaxID=1454010 RepID=UPI000556E47C|nr:biotin--[acetyl-CoA-carboxylase] ligase [Cellulomonas sp. HZM]